MLLALCSKLLSSSGVLKHGRSRLENGVLGTERVVLVNVGLALPGVGEPDVGGVDGGEVLDLGGEVAGLGLEPGG